MDESFKIVVVDDSDLIRRSTVDALEEAGFFVAGEAGSYRQFQSILKSTKAQLYIIDVVMPEKSGIEVAKEVIENSMNSKIIMMSSLSDENIVIESISNGAVDFLHKPFEPEELVNSVHNVFKNYQR